MEIDTDLNGGTLCITGTQQLGTTGTVNFVTNYVWETTQPHRWCFFAEWDGDTKEFVAVYNGDKSISQGAL